MFRKKPLLLALSLAALALVATVSADPGGQGMKAPSFRVDVYHELLSGDPASTLNAGVEEIRQLLTPVLASTQDPTAVVDAIRAVLNQAYPGKVSETAEPPNYEYSYNSNQGAWVRVCNSAQSFTVDHFEGPIVSDVTVIIPL